MRGFDNWALSPSNRTQGAALQHRHARTCRPRVIVDSAVEHPVTRLIHDEASQQRQRCSSGVHRCFTRVASKQPRQRAVHAANTAPPRARG